jgi:hypothetical protein
MPQLDEVALPQALLIEILRRIEWLRGPPAPATLIRQHSAGCRWSAAPEIRLPALLTAFCRLRSA